MQRLLRTIRLWMLIALVVFFAYFSYSNQARVDLYLPPFIARIVLPGYIAYLAFFLGGAIVVSFYFALASFGKSREIRRLRKQLSEFGVDTGTADDVPSSIHAGSTQPLTKSSAGVPLP